MAPPMALQNVSGLVCSSRNLRKNVSEIGPCFAQQQLRRQRGSRSRRRCLVRAEGEGESKTLAPVKPRTPMGEMMSYYLSVEPHLFKDALETQFARIRDEREERQRQMKEKEESAEQTPANVSSSDMVLYRRMDEVRSSEQRLTVEDLMYASVLEKFLEVGVDMMPRLENVVESSADLRILTEGIHSKEALDMVKEHIRNIMGPASVAFAEASIRMSKLQAAQVYAASVMFGYFLRRVDKRFQLERSMGLLPENREDAVARLERLFLQADHPDTAEDLDSVPAPSAVDLDSVPSPSEPDATTQGGAEEPIPKASAPKPAKSVLRKYIESFDQSTVQEMASLVSLEGAALVEMQTHALFGDLAVLQRQMQEAVGQDAISMEDLMQRVQQAVASGAVDVVTVTVATQRRAVLEAVAFGTFLRDVEVHVDSEYGLLSPVGSSSAPGSPGGSPGSPGGPSGGPRRGGGGPLVGI